MLVGQKDWHEQSELLTEPPLGQALSLKPEQRDALLEAINGDERDYRAGLYQAREATLGICSVFSGQPLEDLHLDVDMTCYLFLNIALVALFRKCFVEQE